MTTTAQTTFDPRNWNQACPDHGLTACSICHEREGECAAGGCERDADPEQRFEFRREDGTVVEVRTFCTRCGTDPELAFLRRGMVRAPVSS
jgi:hypothetical protein